ncbi:hypothetical protein [Paractinoplanes durhamensis]|uniref:TetR family transcriptional regulator n=1 Tax=Paractinoplanes durhamensis TaxID=113563 RepID=A0ABQ3ZAG4_9ACTN|nr:hypothetical protein [Actinoplanes durhamensis]GIE06799.1 hypothetical protein Adu01nite_81490 [Actinoplanes durhamensis]
MRRVVGGQDRGHAVGEHLAADTPADVLQLRMALLSINAAVDASAHGDFTDEQILAAAHRHATVLVGALLG